MKWQRRWKDGVKTIERKLVANPESSNAALQIQMAK